MILETFKLDGSYTTVIKKLWSLDSERKAVDHYMHTKPQWPLKLIPDVLHSCRLLHV